MANKRWTLVATDPFSETPAFKDFTESDGHRSLMEGGGLKDYLGWLCRYDYLPVAIYPSPRNA